MVKPEDYQKVSDKLGDEDVVSFVDEQPVDEVNQDVLNNFIDQYGEKKGKQIYYATANKQERDPETFHTEDADWDKLLAQTDGELNEEGDLEQAPVDTPDNQASDKLKADVQKFITRLNLGQFKDTLAKINTPVEQAEVIAAFAEVVGVPRAKLSVIMQTLKQQAESVNPRMKKSDLVEHVLRTKNKK